MMWSTTAFIHFPTITLDLVWLCSLERDFHLANGKVTEARRNFLTLTGGNLDTISSVAPHFFGLPSRVNRGVGGWFIRPKKCLTPSGDENSRNRLKI